MVIKLKDILNEQGKFDALKNKIFKSKDFKEEPIIKEPTRAEKDEAWKQENCNNPEEVMATYKSSNLSNVIKRAKEEATKKIVATGHEGPFKLIDKSVKQLPDGDYYCLICMTKGSL